MTDDVRPPEAHRRGRRVAAPTVPTRHGRPEPRDRGDVELLGLIDRLAALLDRSDLTELEVEAGGTGLVLRKPVGARAAGRRDGRVGRRRRRRGTRRPRPPASRRRPDASRRHQRAVGQGAADRHLLRVARARSAPYVQVGGEVAVGQVIGLIEAMKLFNEIKSDLAGRVTKVVPETGTLVKAKQPLIEVVPL